MINTRIYDGVRETPLLPAPNLSRLCKMPVLLKREDMQPVFSFKIRGAYHKMRMLSADKLKGGVIAASAGNHAQGVAWSAQRLQSPATIVMPAHTQRIKVTAVKDLGARVILEGESFDDAYHHARLLAQEKGMTFIPPFDDADIIAGNGTIAAEILRQHTQPIQAVFCAVGGGGLISGVATYIKSLRPEIRVIGVEAEESASFSASLKAGRRITLPAVGRFADAVAVKTPGKLPFQISRNLVDDILVVNNDLICAAIKDVYDDTRVIVEPSGALAVAGIRKYAQQRRNHNKTKPLAAIVCGANMNFDRLRFIAERAEIGEHREILLAVTIPEQPGSFNRFCNLLGSHNITEFNYRMTDHSKIAHIFVGIEVQKPDDKKLLLKKLRQHQLPSIDLTGDEMSKLHIRHMVGGRANAKNERLYRFEFPERTGALRVFLERLAERGKGWSISLFHYRNHGADVGRVLCAIQVPDEQVAACEERLRAIGYPFWHEGDNRAYRLFLWRGDS